MCYSGFWTYRDSNDLIFVVESGEDWVLANFSRFMEEMVKPVSIKVYRFSRQGDCKTLKLDWSKLISIEVQVKKITTRGGNLHPKFYFQEGYVKGLFSTFKSKNFNKNFDEMAEWWREDNISHPNEVADATTKYDEIVVDGPMFKDGHALVPSSLPRNKNVHVVTSRYHDNIMTRKAELQSKKRKFDDISTAD